MVLSPGRYPIIYQNKPWKKTQVNHQIPYLRLQILLSSSHHFTAFLYLLSPFQLLNPSLVPTTTGLTSSNQSSYTKARITVHVCTHISAHHFPIWVGPNLDPLSPTKRPRDLPYSPIKRKGCVYTRKSDPVNQQKKWICWESASLLWQTKIRSTPPPSAIFTNKTTKKSIYLIRVIYVHI